MGCAHSRFTVLFEGPFWIGLYEREEDGLYTVCKVTFGAEPSGAEVYAFLCTHWHSLRFGPAVAAGPAAQKAPGFKRAMRAARAQTAQAGMGTKARHCLLYTSLSTSASSSAAPVLNATARIPFLLFLF